MIKQGYLIPARKELPAMLQPEPRLLKFMKLTTQSGVHSQVQLSAAAQALIIYSLVAGREREAGETPATCTALAVRRKHGIFFIHCHGTPPRR
jgi:hypothetical protein